MSEKVAEQMKRVEKFREQRKIKRKFVVSVLFFVILAAGGILITDYSVNSLMSGEKRFSMISWDLKGDSVFVLNILNKKIIIDTSYIKRDMNNFKRTILHK